MANLRVAFSGASGTGKTTLANWLALTNQIPFVSSSMSDCLPKTSSIPQSQMLEAPLLNEEKKLVEIRHRIYSEKESFVTDRSFLDSMAYFLLKLSGKGVTDQMVESFLANCKAYLVMDLTHLIFVTHTYGIAKNWEVEANNKRITNTYFQWMVSSIMSGILYDSFIGPDYICESEIDEKGDIRLKITSVTGKVLNVLVLEESDLEERKQRISSFLIDTK